MKLRQCTTSDLANIDASIELLKRARASLRAAGTRQTVKKILSALKSAGGARRHCERSAYGR